MEKGFWATMIYIVTHYPDVNYYSIKDNDNCVIELNIVKSAYDIWKKPEYKVQVDRKTVTEAFVWGVALIDDFIDGSPKG